MSDEVRNYLEIFPILAALLVILWVSKLIKQRLVTANNSVEAQMSRGVIAPTLDRGGYYFAVGLAAAGSLIGGQDERSWADDIAGFLLDGVVAVGFFILAALLLDWLILPRVNNNGELAKGNMAVATVHVCAYLGLGAIMMASFSGDGAQNRGQGLLSALLFSLLGLVVLFVVYKAYDIYHNRRGGDLDTLIQNKDMTAALECGSVLLGTGVVLGFSITGDFTGWASDIRSFAIAVPFALAAILAGRLGSRLLVSRDLRGRNTNLAEACVRAMLTLMVAIVAGVLIV